MQLLKGKDVSDNLLHKIKANIIIKKYNNINLNIIVVGSKYASNKYVKNTIKKTKLVGIEPIIHNFKEDVTEDEIIKKINSLNNDSNVNGIFVQLPLPKHINYNTIINYIEPTKDVEGSNTINVGATSLGLKTAIQPCTPASVMRILDYYSIDVSGKSVCVINTSNIVGKPLVNILMNKKATVISCNSKTTNLSFYTKNVDIVISATGIINFIKEDMIKENAIVIDVGISKDENGDLVGDVDFENVSKKCSFITPVPGGIGPITVASLINNTLHCFKIQNNIL